ncbi:MAG TPA: DUF3300 domain-containing protein [Candidatus Dormibacteraeota bacterium]|jgi:hypothetical protein|nr:DUF3300 domain-containing protein [Candidatus Dormibacteraeota bacterium]
MSVRQISTPEQGATGKIFGIILAAFVMCCVLSAPAMAQGAPYFAPQQLDHMVSRIALYPDPLLAQTLAAATFPDQVSDASYWADEHHGLTGNELADAIEEDELPWDPSVQALLPFPAVLHMMASDMNWTNDLGNAFLGQQQDVMYAVQRMRQRARDYGYLRTGPQIIVGGGPYITILPARADYVVVPYYDPVVVYARPRPGFFIGGAIGFRFGVTLGASYRPWGWGYNRIAWDRRVVFINNAPWQRTWVNRHEYVHPYTVRRYPEHHYVREHENHGHEVAYRAHERNEERREERHEDRGRVENHGHDVAHDNRGHEDHGHDVAHDNRGHEDHGHDVAHDNRGHEDHGHDNSKHENHGKDDHGQDKNDDKGHGDKGDHGDRHR